MEKAEMSKQLTYSMKRVEALKSELKAATSEKKTSDFEKTKIDGRLENAMEELATKKRATVNRETQTIIDLPELSNWEVQTYELIAVIERFYHIFEEK